MIKTVLSIIISFLLIVPCIGNAAYLIKLKNGGELTTPHYWLEDGQVCFFSTGGIAGIEKNLIAGIEKVKDNRLEKEIDRDLTSENSGEKVASIQKLPVPEKPLISSANNEKVNIQAYKDKKDKLQIELDESLEKLREATQRKDTDAKEKAREEMRKTSSQIYKLTDEAKEKNKGKLPDGWWEK